MSRSGSNLNLTYGINFIEVLAILFIGLKLAGIITWSWWWILSPIWIEFLYGFISARSARKKDE